MHTSVNKYKVGAVAGLFEANNEGEKKVKKKRKSNKLAELFTVTPVKKQKKEVSVTEVPSFNDCLSPTKEKPKKKSDKTSGFCPPPGIVHESLKKEKKKEKCTDDSKLTTNDNDESEKPTLDRKKQRKNRKKLKYKETEALKNPRTIFIGNLPLSCTKKVLLKHFKTYGEIDNVRFRCPPPADPRIPKKVVALKKDFHKNRSNCIAFVCYKESESAEKACKMNGQEFLGLHLRVDISSNDKQHSKSNSVFIGNVPFDIEEEVIREHFQECGKVENVRIIRDNKSGLGKGFGYIQFKKKESVSLALNMNETELKGRVVRVMRCMEQEKNAAQSQRIERRKAKKQRKSDGQKPNLSKGNKNEGAVHSQSKFNPVFGQERRSKLIKKRKEKKRKDKKLRHKIIAKKLGSGHSKVASVTNSVQKKSKHFKSTKSGTL